MRPPCKHCGTQFVPRSRWQLYCTDRCWRSAYNRRDKERKRRTPHSQRKALPRAEAERLKREQGWRCAICQRVRKSSDLCADHDHRTGELRGMLCNRCNTALGQVRDSIIVLLRAIRYLLMHGMPIIGLADDDDDDDGRFPERSSPNVQATIFDELRLDA